MAIVYITEYAGIAVPTQAPSEPPVNEQTVAIGASSAQSKPFTANTRLIRVSVDAICSVVVGANPTATTTNGRFAANQTEYRAVQPGHILACITNT